MLGMIVGMMLGMIVGSEAPMYLEVRMENIEGVRKEGVRAPAQLRILSLASQWARERLLSPYSLLSMSPRFLILVQPQMNTLVALSSLSLRSRLRRGSRYQPQNNWLRSSSIIREDQPS